MDDYSSFGIFNIDGYSRRDTLQVMVGSVGMGGSNPIRLQTMTTTNTNSTEDTLEQTIRAIEAGAELVRMTTQGVREAKSLGVVRQRLRERGYSTPVIADVHFNPAAAMEAASLVDKIRINPGNFSDKSRTSAESFTESDYEEDLARAEERFVELLAICKNNGVTLRIGVNHGSLSQRIMSRYGDTPAGMAYSAMEFVRICSKHGHQKVVVSMKSSNTRVMVQATRLLVNMMAKEGLNYPLHLGVTEAGEGEDGRIKSAVGIGALLIDGIGDTIRVSLTEEPENEIPVARELVNVFGETLPSGNLIPQVVPVNPFEYKRRQTHQLASVGGNKLPVVMAHAANPSPSGLADWGWIFDPQQGKWSSTELSADLIYVGSSNLTNITAAHDLPLVGTSAECKYPLYTFSELKQQSNIAKQTPLFVEVESGSVDADYIKTLSNYPNAILVLNCRGLSSFYTIRNLIFSLINAGLGNPSVINYIPQSDNSKAFQVESAAITGSMFIDGLCDGIMLTCPNNIPARFAKSIAFGILQAARVRISKTEFISCPGCGRTLFNLNATLLKVKERTAHLKGLKIGVMGCIVNGPGEMADADYGYVGSGPGRVTLYKKKEVVKKNIAEEHAVDELIALIRENGDWVEKQT